MPIPEPLDPQPSKRLAEKTGNAGLFHACATQSACRAHLRSRRLAPLAHFLGIGEQRAVDLHPIAGFFFFFASGLPPACRKSPAARCSDRGREMLVHGRTQCRLAHRGASSSPQAEQPLLAGLGINHLDLDLSHGAAWPAGRRHRPWYWPPG